jgi:hypothetical protein
VVTIATVQWGNFLGRGKEYVEKLYRGVARHCPVDWKGVCLTDDPETVPDGIEAIVLQHGLDGWWNKLALFKPGMFPKGARVLFLDLDTIPIGDLAPIATYDGPFAMLRDVYRDGRFGSGVMAWEAGTLDHLWTRYEAAGFPAIGGDQQFIEALTSPVALQDCFPGQLVSFKADLQGSVPPPEARVCFFHGLPRPHQCGGWVRDHWI